MICFDLDGVIFKYDTRDYMSIDNNPPAYLTPGCFRHKEPDEKILKVFKRCLKVCPNDTYIVTGVPPVECRNQIILDKIMCVNDTIPEFDIGTHFIAATGDKMSFIEWIRGSSITKKDILVDDWNPNLYTWAARGGTAIKYINGINTPESWVGDILDSTLSENELFLELMDIIVKSGGKNG